MDRSAHVPSLPDFYAAIQSRLPHRRGLRAGALKQNARKTMDQHLSSTWKRSLQRLPSRRDLLHGLAGGGLAALAASFGMAAAAARNTKRHQKRADQNKKTKKKRRGRAVSPATAAPPGPALAYQCPGPKIDDVSGDGLVRFAQTFVAERGGTLRQIQFTIQKSAATGDYLVQLLRVVNGKPSTSPNDVLAAITVPDAAVATGADVALTGTFAGPALVAGAEYAAAFSRPGVAPGQVAINTRKAPDGCGGKLFIADGAGPFNEATNQDLLVSVFVD
jgi:hypothetical protein